MIEKTERSADMWLRIDVGLWLFACMCVLLALYYAKDNVGCFILVGCLFLMIGLLRALGQMHCSQYGHYPTWWIIRLNKSKSLVAGGWMSGCSEDEPRDC